MKIAFRGREPRFSFARPPAVLAIPVDGLHV